MFCRICGTALKDGAAFCHSCGAQVKKDRPAPVNENVIVNTDVINEKLQAPVSEASNDQSETASSPFAQPYVKTPPMQNEKKDYSGFAIASLVLGIVSVLPLCCVNVITAILGIIFSLISIKSSKKGMAIAGLILSIIAIIIAFITFIVFIIELATATPYAMDNSFNEFFEYFLEEGNLYY